MICIKWTLPSLKLFSPWSSSGDSKKERGFNDQSRYRINWFCKGIHLVCLFSYRKSFQKREKNNVFFSWLTFCLFNLLMCFFLQNTTDLHRFFDVISENYTLCIFAAGRPQHLLHSDARAWLNISTRPRHKSSCTCFYKKNRNSNPFV